MMCWQLQSDKSGLYLSSHITLCGHRHMCEVVLLLLLLGCSNFFKVGTKFELCKHMERWLCSDHEHLCPNQSRPSSNWIDPSFSAGLGQEKKCRKML